MANELKYSYAASVALEASSASAASGINFTIRLQGDTAA